MKLRQHATYGVSLILLGAGWATAQQLPSGLPGDPVTSGLGSPSSGIPNGLNTNNQGSSAPPSPSYADRGDYSAFMLTTGVNSMVNPQFTGDVTAASSDASSSGRLATTSAFAGPATRLVFAGWGVDPISFASLNHSFSPGYSGVTLEGRAGTEAVSNIRSAKLQRLRNGIGRNQGGNQGNYQSSNQGNYHSTNQGNYQSGDQGNYGSNNQGSYQSNRSAGQRSSYSSASATGGSASGNRGALTASSPTTSFSSSTIPVIGVARGAASYTVDFPDSTRGTAQLSPSSLSGSASSHQLGGFGDRDGSFPDLTEKEFLNPSLHVHSVEGGSRSAQRARSRLRYGNGLRPPLPGSVVPPTAGYPRPAFDNGITPPPNPYLMP
jgi:hypothetical protein